MTKESGGFDQIDQWKSTMFLYSSALKSINTKIEILNNEFIQLYNYNPIEHITSRLKTPESIVKKLKNDGCEVTIENMVEHLNDIAGIRIICSFMSDIYPIADMIARQADITVLHVKDYIKYPKTNGYKSYHMVVTIPVYLTDGRWRPRWRSRSGRWPWISGPVWSIRSITNQILRRRTICSGN